MTKNSFFSVLMTFLWAVTRCLAQDEASHEVKRLMPRLVEMDFNQADGSASLSNRGTANFEGYFFSGADYFSSVIDEGPIHFSTNHAPSNSGGFSIRSSKPSMDEQYKVVLGMDRTEVLELLNPPEELLKMTLTAWVNVDKETSGKHVILANNEGNTGWEFYYDATENRLGFRFGGSDFFSESGLLTKGTWTFIAFVFDGTVEVKDRIRFFTGDGNAITERGRGTTFSKSLPNNSQATAIALDAGPYLSDAQFQGYIDNLMIGDQNDSELLTEIMQFDDAAALKK